MRRKTGGLLIENPYRLARDIRGIGFRTADAIAMKLGMTREAPQRVRAGISFALQEATDDGHCGLPVEDLVKLATTLLEVDESIVRTALTHHLAGDEVVADTIENRPCVFLRGLYLAERGIAERLQALSKGSPPWPRIDIDKAVPWVEKKTDKTLAASQRAAVEMVLRSKVAVVTGGPGVGKTTLLDTILRILAANGTRLLLAPILLELRLNDRRRSERPPSAASLESSVIVVMMMMMMMMMMMVVVMVMVMAMMPARWRCFFRRGRGRRGGGLRRGGDRGESDSGSHKHSHENFVHHFYLLRD